jgi:hypothetical protein
MTQAQAGRAPAWAFVRAPCRIRTDDLRFTSSSWQTVDRSLQTTMRQASCIDAFRRTAPFVAVAVIDCRQSARFTARGATPAVGGDRGHYGGTFPDCGP